MADPVAGLAKRLWHRRYSIGQIVGIPRGGLIVAAALAYRLDVHDVGAFSTRYYRRTDGVPVIQSITRAPTVRPGSLLLVVEDGTATGTLMTHARDALVADGAQVLTAALWVSKGHKFRPDVWIEEVDVLPSGASLLAGDDG